MPNEITYTAAEYAATKTESPFRIKVEKYTIFDLIGDPTGLKVLDAGCGDGLYARELIVRGADHVIGVDAAADFIDMANKKNDGYEGRIEYAKAFIQDFPGVGDRDLVVGSYVLSYPHSLEEAVAYCTAMASHLKPGGKFVGFNNNPFDTFRGSRFQQYGFEKEQASDVEGAEVVYRVDGMNDPIVNYYLHPETYEEAFREAGFREFRWQQVLLDPSEKDNPYWEAFFDIPPFIAMLAIK